MIFALVALGYLIVAGVTFEVVRIVTEEEGDPIGSFTAGMLWPMALPALAGMIAVRRVIDWRADRAARVQLPRAEVRK